MASGGLAIKRIVEGFEVHFHLQNVLCSGRPVVRTEEKREEVHLQIVAILITKCLFRVSIYVIKHNKNFILLTCMYVESASFITFKTSGRNLNMVGTGTLKKYDCDFNESPDARKHRVI